MARFKVARSRQRNLPVAIVLAFVLVLSACGTGAGDVERSVAGPCPDGEAHEVLSHTRILLPDGFSGDSFSGDDTWGFRARRDSGGIGFSSEEGPGTPYEPTTLENPVPSRFGTEFEKFDTALIIQACDGEGIAGVLYTDETSQPISAWFFAGDGSYRQLFRVSYDSSEQAEVVAILSTARPA